MGADDGDDEGVQWLASLVLAGPAHQGEPRGTLLCVPDGDLGSEVSQFTEIIIFTRVLGESRAAL